MNKSGEANLRAFKEKTLSVSKYLTPKVVKIIVGSVISGALILIFIKYLPTHAEKHEVNIAQPAADNADPSQTMAADGKPLSVAGKSQVDFFALQADLKDLSEKMSTLALEQDSMNAKIVEIQDKLNNQLTTLKSQADASRSVANKAIADRKEWTNKFDINKLSIVELDAQQLTVVDHGARVSIKPGQALPGGVVFLKYDAQSKILTTSAGAFQVN